MRIICSKSLLTCSVAIDKQTSSLCEHEVYENYANVLAGSM